MFAVLGLGVFSFGFVQALVSPVLPVIQRDLHSSPATTSWLLTGTLLTSSVSTPVFSRLSDMFGKKRLYLLACTCLAIGILIAAAASSMAMLIAARALQGLGGAVFPISASLIRDQFPAHRTSDGIAGISGLFATSGAVGIVAAGPITEHLSYHWLFWIAGAIVILAGVSATLALEETPSESGSVDWQGALLLGAGLSMLLIGVTRAPALGWTNRQVVALLAASAAALWAWSRTELHASKPLVDIRMLRTRPVLLANVATGLSGYAIFAVFFFLPLMVELPRNSGIGFGSSVTEAGLFLLPANLGMLVASPISARLSRTAGSRIPLMLGGLLMTVGMGSFCASHATTLETCATLTVFGCGVGFTYASALDITLATVGPHQTGIAAGMNSISRQIGGSIGAAISASVLASSLGTSGHPSATAFTIVAATGACAASGAFCAGSFIRPARAETTEAPLPVATGQ